MQHSGGPAVRPAPLQQPWLDVSPASGMFEQAAGATRGAQKTIATRAATQRTPAPLISR